MASAARAGTDILKRLRRVVGSDGVLDGSSDLMLYARDASILPGARARAVVLPRSARQVSEIVQLCHARGLSCVPRGAGTGLSGGCLAEEGGIVMAMTRLGDIREVNLRDRYAVVQAAVVVGRLNERLQGSGFCFAPDPFSQNSCTVGGCIATNAGGPRSLRHGLTRDHVLAAEVVLGDGTIVKVGSLSGDSPGIDFTGLFAASEGLLGIITEAGLRLTRIAPFKQTFLGIFDSLEAALTASDEILAAGTAPAALEVLDGVAVAALRERRPGQLPAAAKSLLFVETEGLEVAAAGQRDAILACCRRSTARDVRQAASAGERERLWSFRRDALAALRHQAPSFWIEDVVVPRPEIGLLVSRVGHIAEHYGLRAANLIHAGDGNVHPVLLFDERDPEQRRGAAEARREMLEQCLACGGSVRGEHGLGTTKRDWLDRSVSPEVRSLLDRVYRSLSASPGLRPPEPFAARPVEGPPAAARADEEQPTPVSAG